MKLLAVIGMIILVLTVLAVSAAFTGWLIMLAVGLGHEIWGFATVPFYPHAFWLGFLFNILFSGGVKATSSK